MDDKLRQRMLEMLKPPTPLEAARSFLQSYVFDADLDTLEKTVRHMVSVNSRTIVQGVTGMEAILRTPLPPGTLASLVARDANRSLDDPSDEGAAAWLADLAARVRQWMGHAAPAPE